MPELPPAPSEPHAFPPQAPPPAATPASAGVEGGSGGVGSGSGSGGASGGASGGGQVGTAPVGVAPVSALALPPPVGQPTPPVPSPVAGSRQVQVPTGGSGGALARVRGPVAGVWHCLLLGSNPVGQGFCPLWAYLASGLPAHVLCWEQHDGFMAGWLLCPLFCCSLHFCVRLLR